MSSDLHRDPTSTPRFWMAVDQRIERAVQRLASPVRGIYNSAKGSVPALAAQVRARFGEVVSDREVAQVFGLASVPPAETEIILVHVGGDPGHPVAVADIDRNHRPDDLVAGESVLYSTGQGRVHVKADGSVVVSSVGGATVTLTAAGAVEAESIGGATYKLTEAGAVEAESVGGSKLELGSTGTVHLESQSGLGTIDIALTGVISLNGGVAPVARVGDAVAIISGTITGPGNLTVLA